MALKATVFRAELQLSDMDRHYYATHALTLARHPSETDERLMVRLLAFALYADDRLEFGRGLSSDDEPDLWRKSRTGEIELWIDLGQPDDSRIRKACGRAQQVVVVNYSGRGADIWWDKAAASLARCGNLTVIDVAADTVAALAALADRGMRLQCMIQDGHVELYGEGGSVTVQQALRMAPTERAS
ncbi:MAG: YaeQ family protein [Luteimonas sp.]